MSPFCQVTLGSETFATQNSNGNCPKWNREFVFAELAHTSLHVSVLHKAILFGQTEVGRCTIKLPLKVFECNRSFALSNKGENVGKIFIEINVYEKEGENYFETKAGGVSKNESDYGADLNDSEIIFMKRKVAEQNDCKSCV